MPIIVPPPAISPERVVEFDFFAVEPEGDDLHVAWKRLHDGPDIFYTPLNGGHWVFTRAEDIVAAWHDPVRFSNAGVAMMHEDREMRLYPGEADLPDHAFYRTVLQPFFSPRAIQRLQDDMQALAQELIAKIRPDGGCDFQQALAHKLPIYVFLQLMQLPREDAAILLPAADWLSRDPNPESFQRALNAMKDYLAERIQERRIEPRDDLLSHLIAARIGNRAVTEREVFSMASNVMFGGLDTVVSSMGFFMIFLARHPDHRQMLVDEPDLVPDAIEEMFRRFSIANFGRKVTTDFEYKGMPLRAGDLVLLPAALHNLDDQKFPDPMTVDFRRVNKMHLGFGTGIHRCLGAQLARVEMRIFLSEWLRQIPDFRITDGASIVVKSGRINAVKSLPLEWSL
jgi:cytochrome P450